MFYNYIIDRYKEFTDNKMKKEDAVYICRLMFELTHYGFERYIAAYFHNRLGYITTDIGGINDGGIDVIGSKTRGHKDINIAIQCKKRTYDHIKKGEILTFNYNSQDREKYATNAKRHFVTTTIASNDAKKVANEYGINVIDCRTLIKMKKYYSLDDFAKDFKKEKYIHWTYKRPFFTRKDVTGIINSYLANPENYKISQPYFYKKYNYNNR